MADAPRGDANSGVEASALGLDADRLTNIAKALGDRGVPPELVPPLAASIFDARIADSEDVDTPWAEYAEAATTAIAPLEQLTGWLEDESPSARSRDLSALDCVVEDEDGEMAMTADEGERRRSLLGAIAVVKERLRTIADVLGADAASGIWGLLWPPPGVWKQVHQTPRPPPGHVVAFLAYEIAHAHGHTPRGKRKMRPSRIAHAAHAVFERDRETKTRSQEAASVAVSQVRTTLSDAGWADTDARREAFAWRYWKRAAALRAQHGDTLFGPWPTDTARPWLARPTTYLFGPPPKEETSVEGPPEGSLVEDPGGG